MNSKKAEIKMFETTAVLIIFFFLLAISLSFYYNFSYSNQVKELGEIRRVNAFQVAVKTLFMPEFDCSFGGVRLNNCYDEIKIKKFSYLFNNNNDFRNTYIPIFGTASIKVSEIYPNNNELILYNFTPQNFNNKIISFSPALLYNPNKAGDCFGLMGGCSFAVVEVSYYD